MKNNFLLITSATSSIAIELINSFIEPKNLVLHARNEIELDLIIARLPISHNIIKWIYDFNEIDNLAIDLKQFISDNNININEFVHFSGVLSLGSIRTISLSKSLKIFNINFFSALEIIRILISKTNTKAVKNIVLISSLSSMFGEKGNSLYVSSKSALDGLVRSLSLELAPLVRINSVLPGGINTKMTSAALPKDSALLKNYPLGEGQCLDVVNYIEFLLSEKSRWITGQNVVIDGGKSRTIFFN
ncbi:MAG: NAD(P)-dependent dehydrogenase (short-subunit alcohol dehydrogenase family) [Polaribacter sp.]|jgi:NAD(P)-dependent dehydrogenase (short-subunit alcohol dehydrogenase family)